MKRLFLALLLVFACEDSESPVITPPTSDFESLTTMGAVLHNLELAYNERNAAEFEKLLDESFTFYLSTGDVNNGYPAQWDRGVEVTATSNLFSRTPVEDLDPVKSILMDVQFEDGVQWDPITVGDETWYTTTAFYFFQITVQQEPEDKTYFPDANSKAQFTVRNAGTEENPEWQLVEWRDLGAGTLLTPARAAIESEASTWGKVKSLYR